MPEKPKGENEGEKKQSERPETGDKSSWSEDQKKHDYYYDDAHGYEVFEPDKEDEEHLQVTRSAPLTQISISREHFAKVSRSQTALYLLEVIKYASLKTIPLKVLFDNLTGECSTPIKFKF